MTRLRCAISTRKSTEEGLEQDFNSLDAQRAACEAFIKSQASEGWVASKTRYDDGGFSGATLDRLGLKALIAELEAGRVQVVVGYKNAVRRHAASSGKSRSWLAGLLYDDTGPRGLVSRVDLEAEQVRISLDVAALFDKIFHGQTPASAKRDLCLIEPIRLKKRGVECKLVLTNGQGPRANPDPTLIRLVAPAHCWLEDLKTGRARSRQDIIKQHGVDHADVARVLHLALLAPDIIEDILEGRQPPELTATRLRRITDLPLSWAEQRGVLGFS